MHGGWLLVVLRYCCCSGCCCCCLCSGWWWLRVRRAAFLGLHFHLRGCGRLLQGRETIHGGTRLILHLALLMMSMRMVIVAVAVAVAVVTAAAAVVQGAPSIMVLGFGSSVLEPDLYLTS